MGAIFKKIIQCADGTVAMFIVKGSGRSVDGRLRCIHINVLSVITPDGCFHKFNQPAADPFF